MEHQNKRRDAQPPVYTVDEPAALLPFLLANVKGKSRNNVKSLLSRRLVAVDGVPVSRFDTPLSPGQRVSILSASAPRADALPFPILYEDEHLIVVNKPAKLLSVANDKEKTRTAYHMVTDYVKARRVGDRIFVIHRLDRDTSGVLMFARDPETKELFQGRWNEIVANGFSLLDISIETGRKNQIRVHMKEKGCPVAGDKQYSARTNPIGRLCLHANELSFTHPATGEPVTFKAKMPRDFNRVFR